LGEIEGACAAARWRASLDADAFQMPDAAMSTIALRATLLVLGLTVLESEASAQTRPTRFWNLTQHTISEFYLAPAGTTNWGPNQCKNDKDGTVDPDERLRITGATPGSYDAKLTDVSGRSCLVRGIKIEAGEIFSIEEKDLTECSTR
jgi:hypothetical protein